MIFSKYIHTFTILSRNWKVTINIVNLKENRYNAMQIVHKTKQHIVMYTKNMYNNTKYIGTYITCST